MHARAGARIQTHTHTCPAAARLRWVPERGTMQCVHTQPHTHTHIHTHSQVQLLSELRWVFERGDAFNDPCHTEERWEMRRAASAADELGELPRISTECDGYAAAAQAGEAAAAAANLLF